MKRHSSSLRAAAVLLLLAVRSSQALTVPVAEDTYSTTTNTITPANGAATSLLVGGKQAAFVRFDLSALNFVPVEFQPANIVSVTLRLFVDHAAPAGALTVSSVTTAWTETPAGASAAEPTIASAVLATVPAAEVVSKTFVSVDVTAAVKAALTAGTDFGFAIQSPSPAAIMIASKEGPGLGYAAELDIEANLAKDATGRLNGNLVGNVTGNVTGNLTGKVIGSVAGNVTGALTGNASGSAATFRNALVGDVTGLQTATVVSAIGGVPAATVAAGVKAAGAATPKDLASTLVARDPSGNFAATSITLIGKLSLSGGCVLESRPKNTGGYDLFLGENAGLANTSGEDNVFVGPNAGAANVSGIQNSCFGISAGAATTGSFNSFFGAGAGQLNSNGQNNVFVGNTTGVSNTTGSNNVFIGGGAGSSNTIENYNTLIGTAANAAAGVTNSTAIGFAASVTASNSIVLGPANGTNGATNNVQVGIGTSAPNSSLQVNGSLSLPIRTSSVAINTLSATDYVLVATALNSGVTLPAAAGITGRIYVLKNLTGGNFGLYTVNNQTIDGVNATSVPVSVPNGAAFHVQSDGANWIRIN